MSERFICKECGKEFSCAENLSKHLKSHGMNNKQYYDKWIKNIGEGICCVCDNSTLFRGITYGYGKYCSQKCKRIGAGKKTSKTWEERKKLLKDSYEFECKECSEKFKTHTKLNNHIIKIHGLKKYYDRWIEIENKGICKICGNPTEFYNRIDLGYKKCCSKECREKHKMAQRTKTNLIKYGVENVFQSIDIKKKIKESCIEKYGVDNNMKSQNGKDEFKLSMNIKYGIDWPSQNRDSLEKIQKSARKMKKFKNSNLWYQGTYELDFLEKFYDKIKNICRGPSIRYKFNGHNRVYHPDFYVPELNLIVEIKSTYFLNMDKEIEEKKKTTIHSGFNFIMILDKNYDEFEKIYPI